MPLTIELRPSEKQTAFNLKRWRELFADPDLARLPHRIETDRHGHILMSPPPAPAHGDQQSEIVYWLCFYRKEIKAPEICVEVLSPSNTPDEIAEKMALYFEAGAQEVWICENGTLQFHFPTTPKIRPSSGMCPTFPLQIDL